MSDGTPDFGELELEEAPEVQSEVTIPPVTGVEPIDAGHDVDQSVAVDDLPDVHEAPQQDPVPVTSVRQPNIICKGRVKKNHHFINIISKDLNIIYE